MSFSTTQRLDILLAILVVIIELFLVNFCVRFSLDAEGGGAKFGVCCGLIEAARAALSANIFTASDECVLDGAGEA